MLHDLMEPLCCQEYAVLPTTTSSWRRSDPLLHDKILRRQTRDPLSWHPLVQYVAHSRRHVVAGAGLEAARREEMLGVTLGSIWGLPVDVAEVGTAGCAAVEDEEEVTGGAQDDLADVVPFDLGHWAVALTFNQELVHIRTELIIRE